MVIALASIAHAAPTSEPAVRHSRALAIVSITNTRFDQTLMKRDNCVFIGEYSVEIVVGSGGPGQAPVSYTHNSLHIEYEGGVNISPGMNENSITSKHQTFNPDKTRLPNPITWYANFNLGYKDCTVEYNGQTYTGKPGDAGKQPTGTSAWVCNVNFPCEGGIAPLPGSK